jgi:hypothetical protein
MYLPKVLQSKTLKTYKNKKLNTANFGDFTHGDYQVFLHLVSKIGGVDEFGKYSQSVQLPDRLISIGDAGFRECISLSSVNFENKLMKELRELGLSVVKLRNLFIRVHELKVHLEKQDGKQED